MSTYVYFVRGEHHAALCKTSMESALKVDPLAKFIVMTDELPGSRAWALDAAIYYIKTDQPIMLANLEAQVSAMFVADPMEPIVFLDTDILLLKKLPASKGDLTITWRDHVKVIGEDKIEGIAALMPYNYGIIIARAGMAATEAMIWMRERIRKMHDSHQLWYGNQLALAELAGPRPKEGSRIDARELPWTLTNHGNVIHIEKIPCQEFNYTPQSIDEDVSGKSVLHFKGHSRQMMQDYAAKLGLGWYA